MKWVPNNWNSPFTRFLSRVTHRYLSMCTCLHVTPFSWWRNRRSTTAPSYLLSSAAHRHAQTPPSLAQTNVPQRLQSSAAHADAYWSRNFEAGTCQRADGSKVDSACAGKRASGTSMWEQGFRGAAVWVFLKSRWNPGFWFFSVGN